MSLFHPIDIETDLEKLKKRKVFEDKYNEWYKDFPDYIGVIWDDSDDPFCYTGGAMFKSRAQIAGGIINVPYIIEGGPVKTITNISK